MAPFVAEQSLPTNLHHSDTEGVHGAWIWIQFQRCRVGLRSHPSALELCN